MLRKSLSRRTVLSAAALAPLFSSFSSQAQTARPATLSPDNAVHTRAVGQKFYADGRPRPFPGCTFISRVKEGSALQKGLAAILEQAATVPLMRKFTLMPKASLHMTLMDGIDDEHRRAPLWPQNVPTDASVQTCVEWCANRLADFHTQRSGDFQMIRRDVAIDKLNSFTVHLKPATPAQDREIRGTRDRLSETLEIREPGHDTYGFHITLGYLIEYLSPDEALEYYSLYQDWMSSLFAALPEVTLGQPEFCTFRDMFAFQTQFYLKD